MSVMTEIKIQEMVVIRFAKLKKDESALEIYVKKSPLLCQFITYLFKKMYIL